MAVSQEFSEFLQTMLSKLNIVDVVSSYVTVERKAGTYWACCPFHHEKTPSFHVNESDQYYHCFGCGASGGTIKFVQGIENCDFIDAVRILAKRVNMEVPERNNEDTEKTYALKRKKERLLQLMNDTAHFYLDNLNSGKADAHIEYILHRGIPSNIVRTFGLGASLNFNDLPRFLLSKGYTKDEMIESGAVNEINGRLSDAQGGRLIYPIINAFDEVVAFGGRLLEQKPDFAKYKNTKETLIFNKAKTLYNINLLKKLRRNQNLKQVIMVEGYMDTISLYQAGFKNVVASMGTSLTQEQARLIKRYTDTVLISYDGDGAGQKANLRGLDILSGEGLNVKVVPLTDGLDPDDVIKKFGAEGYQKCLDQAMPLIDFKILCCRRQYDLSKPEEKRIYCSEAIKIIRTSPSAAEQEVLLKKLRDETGITFESLNRELTSSTPTKTVKREEVPQTVPTPRKIEKIGKEMKASRFIIASFLFGAKYTRNLDARSFEYVSETHTVIAGYVFAKSAMEEKIMVSELFDFFEEGSQAYEELTRILDLNEGNNFEGAVAVKYFEDCVKALKIYSIDCQIKALTKVMAQTDSVDERRQYGLQLHALLKTKEEIKNGG